MQLVMNRSIKLRLLLASTAAVAAFAPVVRATPNIYDGGPSANGTNWNDPVNWQNDVKPTSTDTAVFVNSSGVAPGTVIDTGANQTIQGISIGNGNTTTGFVNNFSIANNTLSLQGNLVGVDSNNAALANVVANGTNTGTMLQVKAGATSGGVPGQTGKYTISSNVVFQVYPATGVVDPNIFVEDANATLTVTGVISTSALPGGANGTSAAKPNLRINGVGTVTFSNTNTYVGSTTVTGGTLIARASDPAPGSGAGVFGGSTFGLQLGRDNVTLPGDNVSVLAADGAFINRGIIVNKVATSDTTTPRTGSAFIGGAPDGLTPATFGNGIYLGRVTTFRSNGMTAATAIDINSVIQKYVGGPQIISDAEASVIKAEPGILRFNNPGNNYGGSTTLKAGTLQLGAAGVIPNTSGLIFTGGTLDTAGFSEIAGTLTLLANSNLNFGNAGVVTLADSSGVTWNGAATLQLLQWSGLEAGGGTTQFFVGAAPTLSAGQLAAIDFINPAGYAPGIYDAQQLATGEIVPQAVPEPAALGLIGLAGTALLARRRTTKR